MRTFRLRVWIWTVPLALAAALMPSGFRMTIWFGAAMLLTGQGNFVLFSIASRSVRAAATPVEASPLRSAFVAEEDRGGFGPALVEWSGMLLPLAIPIATEIAVFLREGRFAPMPLFYFALGCLPAHLQYTLRFGARSSDWAADPARSRRYRAYIGLVNTLVFGFIIIQGCTLVLMPSSFIWRYFVFVFACYALLYPLVFHVRGWLKRNLAETNCDPMPDACWKWGQYYYNPDDPALIVPSRSGISFSPNFGRRSVRMMWVVVHVLIAIDLFLAVRAVAGV
jgi:hypothetical protein